MVPIPKISSPQEFKDLRPVSILPVLSKILEKIINKQLRKHLLQNNLIPEIQSSFRPGHSCTSALLTVTDDLLLGVDERLILLNFSKAFDTIRHDIFLSYQF